MKKKTLVALGLIVVVGIVSGICYGNDYLEAKTPAKGEPLPFR